MGRPLSITQPPKTDATFTRGNGKDETYKKLFHFKTPGLWKEQKVPFFNTNFLTFGFIVSPLNLHFLSRYFHALLLFSPAVCSWHKAPALFGGKRD